ncbi:MAG: DUF4827 domain-containing protein [Muribaculaceae bacterium]|nr:DUF4827 domain-containing protein [Muribaculaceae bacterium]
MSKKINIIGVILRIAMIFAGCMLLSSCDDNKSYADMLRDEEAAVNWYLAQNRVEPRVPEDSVFQVGDDAPFYRMNNEGSVYMRVISRGDMDNRPRKGQTVYLRFMRYDINSMYAANSVSVSGSGNAENMGYVNGYSLVYGNTVLTSTTQYGAGLQIPLDYLGYDCEVDLIVKSIDGTTDNISLCIPYVYKNLKYFKAEY